MGREMYERLANCRAETISFDHEVSPFHALVSVWVDPTKRIWSLAGLSLNSVVVSRHL
jgi:hypothetical protein